MAKTKKPAELTLEILPPEQSKDALEVINAGAGLLTFLQGLVGFFLQASTLETAALARRATADTLTVPTSKAEDAQLQNFIRTARAERQAIEAHWEVTALVSRLHRKLTAKRAIGADALKAAEDRATVLHERYVADERRRAEEERRRLQAEADERARQEREATLAEYEAAAIAAEESTGTLSAREQAVVQSVLAGQTWQASVQRAGYRDVVAQAARLKSSPKITHALKVAQEAAAIRTQIDIMRELPPTGDTIEVAPQLNPGDRATWTARVVDLDTFRQAAFTGAHGIPLDLFDVNQAALNRYARSLGHKIELWPGIAAKRNLTVV